MRSHVSSLAIAALVLSSNMAQAADAFAQSFQFDPSGSSMVVTTGSLSVASGITAQATAGTTAAGETFSRSSQTGPDGMLRPGITTTMTGPASISVTGPLNGLVDPYTTYVGPTAQ